MSEHFHNTDLRDGRLVSLTIENFRGVRDRATFDLDASVVLLWGPNGTGKTTFFDALLWLLQGHLPRLAAHTMRRSEDYVVSTYRRSSPATVTAHVRINDREFELTRHGFAIENSLEVKPIGDRRISESGQALEELILGRSSLSLSEVLATSGLLQQDDLRLLLRDKPDQRYRQLLRLLGLEVLEQFERHLRSRQKDARAAVRETQQLLDKQQSRVSDLIEQAETVEALIDRSTAEQVGVPHIDSIKDALTTIDLEVRQPGASSQWAALQTEASELARRLGAVIRMIEGVREVPAVPDVAFSRDALLAAERDLEVASEAVEAALHERELLQQAVNQLNQLAKLAISQLQSSQDDASGLVPCPVCLSAVDRAQTIQSLTDRAHVGAALAVAESRLDAAQASEATARSNLTELQVQQRRLEDKHDSQRRLEEEVWAILRELQALQSGNTVVVRGLDYMLAEHPTSIYDYFVGHKDRLLTALRTARDESAYVVATSEATATSLRASEVAIANASQLPQIWARLETANSQLAERQREYDLARRDSAAATGIIEAATDAIEQIFRERFEGLEPLMNDIYGRLDPHPTFTRLDFHIETYNRRGTATATVTDEDEDIRGNPLLIFSSAQANIVALSAFLALGWAARDSGLPFVLMDDPLQALDDVNALGFSDLMRQVRRRRQVILSTHEERFARVMERKLVGRRPEETLLVHRFLGWGRQGPRIETRYLPYASTGQLHVVNG